MKQKISSGSLFTASVLQIDPKGIKYSSTSAFGGAKRFEFNRIECVLLSPGGQLSFQVGGEVFSVLVKESNLKHMQTIEALLEEVRRANPSEPQANASL